MRAGGHTTELEQHVAELHAQARDAVAEVRCLIDGLAPLAVETGGLPAALGELARRRSRAGGPKVNVDCDRGLAMLPHAEAAVAYEIALEAIANAQRHAGASRVDVRVRRTDTALVLSVADDGCGFDASAVPGSGSARCAAAPSATAERCWSSRGRAPGRGSTRSCPYATTARLRMSCRGAGRIVCSCPRPGAQTTRGRASCAC